jgi:hypothetical protein
VIFVTQRDSLLTPLQWHPEAEAKMSHNLRLRDEEAAEALSASVQALQEQQVRQLLAYFVLLPNNFFLCFLFAEENGKQTGPDSVDSEAAGCGARPSSAQPVTACAGLQWPCAYLCTCLLQ